MQTPGTPTFDQLRIFLSVVETGSFAAAGRRLHRATSVISYGIGNLEAQLGLPLFERAGTKRPVLTVAGNALLAEARAVAYGMDGLRAKAKGLLQGLEAEVSFVVDVMVPTARIAEALADFRAIYPTVSLRLHVEALGAVAALVLERRATIGISGPLVAGHGELDRRALGAVPMIPVAAPHHPLAEAQPRPGAARDHIQLVLSDRSPLSAGRDFSVLSDHSWRIADLGAKHALLREGIGWGNMPLPLIADDLASGALVRLDMPDQPELRYGLEGIWRSDEAPGPAATWLLQRFADCMGAAATDAGAAQ